MKIFVETRSRIWASSFRLADLSRLDSSGYQLQNSVGAVASFRPDNKTRLLLMLQAPSTFCSSRVLCFTKPYSFIVFNNVYEWLQSFPVKATYRKGYVVPLHVVVLVLFSGSCKGFWYFLSRMRYSRNAMASWSSTLCTTATMSPWYSSLQDRIFGADANGGTCLVLELMPIHCWMVGPCYLLVTMAPELAVAILLAL